MSGAGKTLSEAVLELEEALEEVRRAIAETRLGRILLRIFGRGRRRR